MSTLDYHTTGIDDEHMVTSEHDDGKPPLRKQQSMLLITVIIDGLIAIIALITEIICCAHMIISMIHAEATMTESAAHAPASSMGLSGRTLSRM